MQDRDYYRALRSAKLLDAAEDEGIDPEMAIAIAERLAACLDAEHLHGHFHFNHHDKETTK